MTDSVKPSTITIPPAALEAGARALASHYSYDWNENEELHAIWKEEAAACITRALNAWPGMHRADWNDKNELDPVIILPLPPQETRDAD